MSSPEDKLIQYLNEAHATELALVSTLRAHIAVSPSGSYRSLLERHLGDTRRQADRLERRLSDLGVSRSLIGSGVGAVQSLLGQVLALTKAPIDLLRGGGGEEKLLKNAKDECATEALEIATYDALEQVALELGDELTAELAREHRAEEEAMLAGLRAEIPGLARDAVAAEVYGIEVYDSSEIGAAQAARSAAGAASDAATELASDAVGEAERVASKAAGATKETAKEARKVPGVEDAEGEVRGVVAGEDDLPIASYDSLKAGEIVERLPRLTQVELGVVECLRASPRQPQDDPLEGRLAPGRHPVDRLRRAERRGDRGPRARRRRRRGTNRARLRAPSQGAQGRARGRRARGRGDVGRRSSASAAPEEGPSRPPSHAPEPFWPSRSSPRRERRGLTPRRRHRIGNLPPQ